MTPEPVRGRRLAGLCGVVYVALSFAVGATAPPPPTLADGPAQVAAYFAQHRTGFLIGNYLGVLAIVPFFVFLAHVTALVRRAEGDAGIAGLTFFGSGTGGHAVGVACLAAFQLIGLSAEPAQKLVSDLANILFGFFFVLQVAFLASAAWAIFSTNVLPRALGWIAIPLAVLQLMASLGTLATEGALTIGGKVSLAALGLYLLWSLAVSIALLRAVTPVAADRS